MMGLLSLHFFNLVIYNMEQSTNCSSMPKQDAEWGMKDTGAQLLGFLSALGLVRSQRSFAPGICADCIWKISGKSIGLKTQEW